MKSESTLRSLVINKINAGVSEESARGLIAQEYPEQEGEIWSLELEKPKYVISDGTLIKDEFVVDDLIQYDNPTEDLDVSILDEPKIDLSWLEESKEQSIPIKSERPVKRNYNTNKRKMRKLFLESDNRAVGHMTALFMSEFKLNLIDAYNNALIIIADYDKKRF